MTASARQERAFALCLGLGPDRSLVGLARLLRADPGRAGLKRAPTLRTLENWSARYGRQKRIADVERKEREEAEKQHLEWVKQHRERLRQEGLLLQQRGIGWLKEKDAAEVSASEAIRAIDAGFKLEALALGEATQRISIEEDEDDRLRQLSDEDLELLIRQARQAQPGSSPGEGEAPSG
jgi:hypothetical protein